MKFSGACFALTASILVQLAFAQRKDDAFRLDGPLAPCYGACIPRAEDGSCQVCLARNRRGGYPNEEDASDCLNYCDLANTDFMFALECMRDVENCPIFSTGSLDNYNLCMDNLGRQVAITAADATTTAAYNVQKRFFCQVGMYNGKKPPY